MKASYFLLASVSKLEQRSCSTTLTQPAARQEPPVQDPGECLPRPAAPPAAPSAWGRHLKKTRLFTEREKCTGSASHPGKRETRQICVLVIYGRNFPQGLFFFMFHTSCLFFACNGKIVCLRRFFTDSPLILLFF